MPGQGNPLAELAWYLALNYGPAAPSPRKTPSRRTARPSMAEVIWSAPTAVVAQRAVDLALLGSPGQLRLGEGARRSSGPSSYWWLDREREGRGVALSRRRR